MKKGRMPSPLTYLPPDFRMNPKTVEALRQAAINALQSKEDVAAAELLLTATRYELLPKCLRETYIEVVQSYCLMLMTKRLKSGATLPPHRSQTMQSFRAALRAC